MPLVKDTLGLASGDVVVLAGDSITWQQMFSNYLMAWLQLTYPSLDLKTYAIGVVGADLVDYSGPSAPPLTAPDASLYERIVYPFEPHTAMIMLGQNGSQTAAEHIATYEELWQNWVDGVSAAQLVMLGAHPRQAATDVQGTEGKSDEEVTFAAATTGVFASHLFEQIGAEWLANDDNAVDIQQGTAEPFGGGYPEGDVPDTTHPGAAGHIAIAWGLLQGLGAENIVSQATINAATAAATAEVNCTVSNVSGNTYGITFDRLDNSLPWAIDEAGRANAVALIPAIEAWQDYSITVSNLAAGTYDIECDSVLIGTATHTELAAGWNMADLTAGPVFDQCQDVLNKIRLFQGFDPANGDSIGGTGAVGQPDYGTVKNITRHQGIQYGDNGLRGATYLAAVSSYISQADTKLGNIHTAATPATRTYTITNQSGEPPVGSTKRSQGHVSRILAAAI